MALSDDLISYATSTFKSQWNVRDGQVVPEPTNLTLGNDAIHFQRATVLYADLSGSTTMVNTNQWYFASEVYKSFLYCAARLIRDNNGQVTAYDGDRVMGIFIGDSQSTNAAKCGLKINSAVKNIIMPSLSEQYPSSNFVLNHVVGIDTSEIRATRTGVRGDNDLVWVGRAANYAAKLTELKEGYATWITGTVFGHLAQEARYGGNPSQLMWEQRSWTLMNNMEVHRSNWWWPL